MTLIQIPDHPGVDIRLWRDDDPAPAVIVTTDEWGQELHLPVSVARQVAAAILATIPD